MQWTSLITLNLYFTALTAVNQTFVPLVLPLLVQHFVGPTRQGTYLGRVRLGGLMTALLMQALAGMISDHSTLRWGRRRPFIAGGTLGGLLALAAVGYISHIAGPAGFWALFAAYLLLMAATNVAQAGVQGFIPDLIPPAQHGRYAAAKSLFELLPVIAAAFTVAPLIAHGHMEAGLWVLAGVMLVAVGVTMTVHESPPATPTGGWRWADLARLAEMTAAFTAIILLLGGGVDLAGAALAEAARPAQLGGMIGVGLLSLVAAVIGGVKLSLAIATHGARCPRQGAFTWWVINRLAFLSGAFSLGGFALYFIQGRMHYTVAEAAAPAGRLMMWVGISLLPAAIVSGWLGERLGERRVVILAGGLAVGGTAMMLLAASLPLLYGGAVLLGLATGLFYTANWAWGVGIVPPEEAGRYLGLANLAGAGAGAIGTYIGGPVADFFTRYVPESPGLGYEVVFGLYGALFLLAVLAALAADGEAAKRTPQSDAAPQSAG